MTRNVTDRMRAQTMSDRDPMGFEAPAAAGKYTSNKVLPFPSCCFLLFAGNICFGLLIFFIYYSQGPENISDIFQFAS